MDFHKASELIDNSIVGIMTQIFLILFATSIISFIITLGLKKLREKFQKTEGVLDEILIDSIMTPLHVLIWVFSISLVFELVNSTFKLELAKFIKPIRPLAAISCISWGMFGFINAIEHHWNNSLTKGTSKLDKTSISAITKIFRILIGLVTLSMVMETFGFSISGLLAFAGGGGVAIGFASKDLVSNFFGALMIYLDKPFKVGDWIRLPEKNIEGYVDRIALRCTVIQTFEKRPMYVPNSVFTTVSIENPSRMTHRKISEIISLRHEDLHVVDKISSDIQSMLKKHKDIDSEQSIIVTISAFTPESIDILINAFTPKVQTEDFYRVKHDIMLKIGKVIESYEAKLALSVTALSSQSTKNKRNQSKKK